MSQHNYNSCNGIPSSNDFKLLNQTYLMPKQYEAYKHPSKSSCNGIPSSNDFKLLNQTYLMPKQYEAYKHPSKSSCNGIPLSNDFKLLNQTYLMPKQYEAFTIPNPSLTPTAQLLDASADTVMEGVTRSNIHTETELGNAATEILNTTFALNLPKPKNNNQMLAMHQSLENPGNVELHNNLNVPAASLSSQAKLLQTVANDE